LRRFTVNRKRLWVIKMKQKIFSWLDGVFRNTDRKHIRRTKNIRLIPAYRDRRGGKLSYAEWAHVVGIFQTLLYQELDKKTGANILDIGCGTGLLGISSEPFVGDGGSYTGIDVMKEDIEFCKSHFNFPNYHFVHFDLANPTYAGMQSPELKPWPIPSASQDMVTALSVWTHLCEEDAIFYFNEIARVLRRGGKAMITFFILDEDYESSLPRRSKAAGRYHNTSQEDWVFNKSAYQSKNWFTTAFAHHPEDAIGVTRAGLDMLLASSGLSFTQYYPGNWKENPGVFFQDVLILSKG
jgi:SAM-dependent methyltransferase